MLANAAAWLHRRRHEKMSQPIGYRRVGGSVRTLQATPGRTDADELVEMELTTTGQTRDWILKVEDFAESGSFIPPKAGDQITSDGIAWDVTEIAANPCWRFSDEYENALRVHTVRC